MQLAMKIVFLALLVSFAEARDIYVVNYCPFEVEMRMTLDEGKEHLFHFGRRDGGWLTDGGELITTDSRSVSFNARPIVPGESPGPWLRWAGSQVQFRLGRHIYRDTWGDIDFDFCDSPNAFPYIVSLDGGGDAVFPASCPDDRASHFRMLSGGGLSKCPNRLAGVGEVITLLALGSSIIESPSDSPAVPTYIETYDPRTGAKVRMKFKWGR